MQSQDANVDELRKIIIRQRELGTQINEELEVQNDLLRLADEEADMFVYALFPLVSVCFTNDMSRLKAKMDIGRKRIGKIS